GRRGRPRTAESAGTESWANLLFVEPRFSEALLDTQARRERRPHRPAERTGTDAGADRGSCERRSIRHPAGAGRTPRPERHAPEVARRRVACAPCQGCVDGERGPVETGP